MIFYICRGGDSLSKPLIELISNESGDYEILSLDMGEGFYADGHGNTRVV